MSDYWEGRRETLYYQVVRRLVAGLSTNAKSIIDVGSGGCPYIDWFPHIPDRASLDKNEPYSADGVRSIQADFLAWQPDRTYDIVLCLQVLEHIAPVAEFAKKLSSLGPTLVVSVPYKWPAGRTASHIHDPVDEFKMFSWFGRRPNFEYICREIMAPVSRLIHVYDPFDREWKGIRRRDAILREMAEEQQRSPDGEEAAAPEA